MQYLGIVIVLCLLAIFVYVVYMMATSARKTKELKHELAASLGFTAVDPSEELLYWISSAYPKYKASRQFELKNVSRKSHPDGTIFLFDLIDTAGEDDSYLAEQAVAAISPSLQLPNFFIFPKADSEGWLTDLANKTLLWMVGRIGNPLDFTDFPEFSRRYLVSASDPEAARSFLRPHILNQLASTRFLSIAANENVFILSSIDWHRKPLDRQILSERINRALQFFTLFQ
jgi:hypothetical protein